MTYIQMTYIWHRIKLLLWILIKPENGAPNTFGALYTNMILWCALGILMKSNVMPDKASGLDLLPKPESYLNYCWHLIFSLCWTDWYYLSSSKVFTYLFWNTMLQLRSHCLFKAVISEELTTECLCMLELENLDWYITFNSKMIYFASNWTHFWGTK